MGKGISKMLGRSIDEEQELYIFCRKHVTECTDRVDVALMRKYIRLVHRHRLCPLIGEEKFEFEEVKRKLKPYVL